MSMDVISLLRAADPVAQPPAVPPAERVRRLIEQQEHGRARPSRAPRSGRPRTRQAWVRARAAVAVPALAALLAGGWILLGSSTRRGVDVLTSAYAATSGGGGVIAAVFVQRQIMHGRPAVSFRRREWIDASSGRRRERSAFPNAVVETATAPGEIEAWTDQAHQGGVVRRYRYSADAGAGASGWPSAGLFPRKLDASAQTSEGIALYRKLYLERALRLVGRERVRGKLLWKLEGVAALAISGARGAHRPHVTPIESTIVLVDPSTYLPVIQRTVDLLRASHPVVMESRLVSYRRLPAGAASEALLSVSVQHPRLRVQGAHVGR